MKIKIITPKINLETGGGSNYSLNVYATELVKLKHDVKVITLGSYQNKLGNIKPFYEIIEEKFSLKYNFQRQLAMLTTLCKYENDTDIYHIDDPYFMIGAIWYKKKSNKVPLIVMLHTYYFCTNLSKMDDRCYIKCNVLYRTFHSPSIIKKFFSIPWRFFETYVYKYCNLIDGFIAVSECVKKIYSRFGINEDKIYIIPEGCMPFEMTYNNYKTENYNNLNNKFNILFLGRLDFKKGLHILIKALKYLQHLDDIILHIVGDGKDKKYFEYLARELNLSKKIIFHGWRKNEDIINFHKFSDIFIHPAKWPDPCPLAVLEAMALGDAIIVSDRGGPPWMIGDAGLIFNANNPKDLADKILLLYKNPQLREEFSKKAKQRFYEMFDYKKTVKKLEEVYKLIIERSKKF